MNPPVRRLVLKLYLFLMLLGFALKIVAGDCGNLESDGFEIFSGCQSQFDQQGNYYQSTCA